MIGTRIRLKSGTGFSSPAPMGRSEANRCTINGELMEVSKIIKIAALKRVESNKPVFKPMIRVGIVTAAWAWERPYTVQNSFLVYLKILAVIHDAISLEI